MAFKFGGVKAREVEKDESVRGNETFVSDDESANRERKPRILVDIIPPIQNAASPTLLMFPVVKDDSYVKVSRICWPQRPQPSGLQLQFAYKGSRISAGTLDCSVLWQPTALALKNKLVSKLCWVHIV